MPRLENESWKRPPLVCELLKRAADEFHTTPNEILNGSQTQNITAARWKVIRELAARKFSTPTIGRWMNRHHSSVLYCLQMQGRDGPYNEPLLPPPAVFDPAAADESGAWAI